jgi:hypothetical protein
VSEYDVGLKADQFGGEAGQEFEFTVGVPPFEEDGLSFDIAQIAQSLHERFRELRRLQTTPVRQDAHERYLPRLLRIG